MLYIKQLYILIISHLYIIIVYSNILLWIKYIQEREFAKQLSMYSTRDKCIKQTKQYHYRYRKYFNLRNEST
jgi:hypothetical protein